MKSKLVEIREKAKMSRADACRHFHVPYRTWENWERGERKCPDYVLIMIAKELESISSDNDKSLESICNKLDLAIEYLENSIECISSVEMHNKEIIKLVEEIDVSRISLLKSLIQEEVNKKNK